MPMSQPVTPIRMNEVANTAVVAAILMSLAQTSASPPPAAGPLTAAMYRLRQPADLLYQRGDRPLHRPGPLHLAGLLGPGYDAEAAEVEPGAEAATGPGQHDGPARSVRGQRVAGGRATPRPVRRSAR